MDEKTTRGTVRKSFEAGYNEVKTGKITAELTAREIELQYPSYLSNAFAQGMIDALRGDPWRYNRTKINVTGNYGG